MINSIFQNSRRYYSMQVPTLIWGSGGAPSRRVQVMLEEKSVQYNSKLKSFFKREHKGEDVMELNPRGQIPILQHNNRVISESLAALFYLESAFPNPKLIPDDLDRKSLVLQRMVESLNLDKVSGNVYRPQMRKMVNTEEEKAAFAASVDALKVELSLWEGHLQSNYMCGTEFTAADVACGPHLLLIKRIGASFNPYPKLKAYVNQLEGRPSFVNSVPPHWNENPSPEWIKDMDI